MSADEFNLEERVLCSDDNCIGLIGSDGRCKECGALYTGSEPLPNSTGDVSRENEPRIDHSPPTEPGGTAAELSEPEEDRYGEEERICCSDDTCVGIIGPDGVCGTCGKSTSSSFSSEG